MTAANFSTLAGGVELFGGQDSDTLAEATQAVQVRYASGNLEPTR